MFCGNHLIHERHTWIRGSFGENYEVVCDGTPDTSKIVLRQAANLLKEATERGYRPTTARYTHYHEVADFLLSLVENK